MFLRGKVSTGVWSSLTSIVFLNLCFSQTAIVTRFVSPLFLNRLVDEFQQFGISDCQLCFNIRAIVSALLKWSTDSNLNDHVNVTDRRLLYQLAKLCKLCEDDHGGYVGMSFSKIFDRNGMEEEFHGRLLCGGS